MESNEIYQDLHAFVDFSKFRYDRDHYRDDEVNVLQPQLEKLGYKKIKWFMGEQDSFGPLTRVCEATNENGNVVMFVYG